MMYSMKPFGRISRLTVANIGIGYSIVRPSYCMISLSPSSIVTALLGTNILVGAVGSSGIGIFFDISLNTLNGSSTK